MLERVIPHSFQLIDYIPDENQHKIWSHLDKAYKIILNRILSFIDTDNDIIVIENVDNSLQNFLLYQIVSTIKVYTQVPVLIVKKPFQRLPKYIRKGNIKPDICNKEVECFNGFSQKNVKEFSPFMLHNCLDGKFSDDNYSRITYYPFKDFPLETINLICKYYFKYEKEEDLFDDFYRNILENKINNDIKQVYKIFNKSQYRARPIFVHHIDDIEGYAEFLNTNPNILPFYTEVGVSEGDVQKVNSLIKNISQQAPQTPNFLMTEKQIEHFAKNMKGVMYHNVCGELGEARPEVRIILDKYLLTYRLEGEVTLYGKN